MTDLIVQSNNLVIISDEERKLYDSKTICEICYGNHKSDKHICDECNNSVCINCVENCSVANKDVDNYKLKCPYCRKEKDYKYCDLTADEMYAFYKVSRKNINMYKKPYNSDKLNYTEYYNTILTVQSFFKEYNETKKEPKQMVLIKDLIYELEKIRELREDLLDKKEKMAFNLTVDALNEHRQFKKMYYDTYRYTANIKQKLDNQSNKLDDIKRQNEQLLKQNQLLLEQNNNLYKKVEDIYNMVSNREMVRKPQQVIKTIAKTLENNLQTNMRIDIVF
jgi:hypothetical protein